VTYDEFAAARLQGLLRYAVMLTGDPHTAQDLVQETMVRVQMKWHRVGRTDVPEIYVKRMLTNAYIDHRRGPWLRRVLLRGEPAAIERLQPAVADPADQAVERDRVWQLLATMPPRQRAALVLRFYEDLGDAEIAEVLDCAVGTVRANISRGLATLRTRLGASLSVATSGTAAAQGETP
jgi:RNA polymerase sigma-70 factor (sigma-E family)